MQDGPFDERVYFARVASQLLMSMSSYPGIGRDESVDGVPPTAALAFNVNFLEAFVGWPAAASRALSLVSAKDHAGAGPRLAISADGTALVVSRNARLRRSFCKQERRANRRRRSGLECASSPSGRASTRL